MLQGACSAPGKAVRPRYEVATIARAHREALVERHGVSCEQRKVLDALVRCRTAALGGHVDRCVDCGYSQPSYNSCRNRHCPKCQALAQHRWLQQRRERILPVHHFHTVFTLPSELRRLVMHNRRRLYALLFEAASSTLLQLAADEKRLGAQLGISVVLHTWSRDLGYHPHVHCVVTGGGLSSDGSRWVRTRPGFLFPVRVMGALFRGKFLHGLWRMHEQGLLERAGHDDIEGLLRSLATKRWIAYSKPPFGDASAVYAYLGRYTHRVGISNARILHADENQVRFRTRHKSQVSLAPVEFLRRLLMHVLPKGFVRIRHYGLLAAGNVHTKLVEAQSLLRPPVTITPVSSEVGARQNQDEAPEFVRIFRELAGIDLRLCPACHSGYLVPEPLGNFVRGPP